MKHPADRSSRRRALALRKATVRHLPTWRARWRMSGDATGPLNPRETGIFASSPRSCSCFLCKRGEPHADTRRAPVEDKTLPDLATILAEIVEVDAEIGP